MTSDALLRGYVAIAGLESEKSAETESKLFLRNLRVENFRSIKEAKFTFQPGLNVIIGANNSAKSAAIDALRIVFGLGTFERKEERIRLKGDDVFVNGEARDARSVSFTATFYGHRDAQTQGQFYELLCPDEVPELEGAEADYVVLKLRYCVDFEYNDDKGRYEYTRSELKGGPSLSNPVQHETLDSIRSIYLAPLRDLVNDKARVGAEIERLILTHTPKGKEEERKNIPGDVKEYAADLISKLTEGNHEIAAGSNLAQYARPYRISETALGFTPSGFSDGLFRSMLPEFTHDLHGHGKLPLSSNGLGLNQLIYASIVLSRRGDIETSGEHMFFLIEEPEAHLHPQLQDSFFYALNEIREHQVFVTSHSPTITAKTDIEKIIVMRRDISSGDAQPLHLSKVYKDRDADREYLHKFLDVTRSQLLFARGAVFVEGITEGMLIQRFSEILGKSLRDNAIEVVVIDSSYGFDHFRPLFDGSGILQRAVFITDGDEDPKNVKSDEQFFADDNSDLDIGMTVSDVGNTATATGYGTFEFGLLRTAVIGSGNLNMQHTLTKAMETAAKSVDLNEPAKLSCTKDFLDFEHPSLAYQKMKESTHGAVLRDADWSGSIHTNSPFKAVKSAFAYRLCQELDKLGDDKQGNFIVPKYISDAVEFVLGGGQQDATDT